MENAAIIWTPTASAVKPTETAQCGEIGLYISCYTDGSCAGNWNWQVYSGDFRAAGIADTRDQAVEIAEKIAAGGVEAIRAHRASEIIASLAQHQAEINELREKLRDYSDENIDTDYHRGYAAGLAAARAALESL